MKEIDHSAIVTDVYVSGDPKVTAHDSDRHNVLWDLIAYGAPETTQYYFTRIPDYFGN